jgi:hypothetical protein
MALTSKPPLSKPEREYRAFINHIWLRWALGFLVPVAFFFGAEFGKKDTAFGYRGLIEKMSPTCQESFERIVVREIAQ